MVSPLVAITPKHEVIATSNMAQLIERQLGQAGFGGDMVRDMADYPNAQPWKGPTPKKGPRKGGRRTGSLGRGWKLRLRRGGTMILTVFNRVRYAVHVEGPRTGPKGKRQTINMRRRGWPNITTVTTKNWRKHRPRIVGILTQRDRRLRRRRAR